MKIKGGYCYNCEKHYSLEELGTDEYYSVAELRKGKQESLGLALYCKDCDSNEDLIILIEE